MYNKEKKRTIGKLVHHVKWQQCFGQGTDFGKNLPIDDEMNAAYDNGIKKLP